MAHHWGSDTAGKLTPREEEVLALLRLHLTNREIAERLGISLQGVKRYVSAIIAKLGVRNRYEAAAWPEKPPWWVGALAPPALLWRRAIAALPFTGSSAAATVSAALLVVALGGLGFMALLLARGGGDIGPAITNADDTLHAGGTPSAEGTPLAISSSPEAPGTPLPAGTPDLALPRTPHPAPAAYSQQPTPAVTPPSPAQHGVLGMSSPSAEHACAVTAEGSVRCWGRNDYGQLGNGIGGRSPDDFSDSPVDVLDEHGERLTGVKAVAAGDDFTGGHTCAVMEAGSVKCWGANSFGQLGRAETPPLDSCAGFLGGNFPCSKTARDVPALASGIESLAAGGLHTCALTTAGRVKCWGRNEYGQLGDGGMTEDWTTDTPVYVCATGATPRCTPEQGNVLTGVSRLIAGDWHTCAVMEAGGTKCWGYNENGELGNLTSEVCHSSLCSTTPLDVLQGTVPIPPGVPGMSLNVERGAGAPPAVDCDSTFRSDTCSVNVGVPFTLSIEANDWPDAQFASEDDVGGDGQVVSGWQTEIIGVHDGLTYEARACQEESRQPFCVGDLGRNDEIRHVVWSAVQGIPLPTLADPGRYGNLLELRLRCTTPGRYELTLTDGHGPSYGAAYYDEFGVQIFPKRVTMEQRDLDGDTVPEYVADSLTIVCQGSPSPGPRPTSTPTQRAGATPTATPTAAAATPGAMSLEGPASVAVGEPFTVLVNANPAPDAPIAGFQSEVRFPSSVRWSWRATCAEEAPALICVRGFGPDGLTARHAVVSGTQPPLPALDVPPRGTATLVELDFVCDAPGRHTLLLLAGGSFGATYYGVDFETIGVAAQNVDADGDTATESVADTLTVVCT